MNKKALIPVELQSYYRDWKMSPGLVSGDHIFMTGFTGVDSAGNLPSDAESQIRNAFVKVEQVLKEAGLGFTAVVDMTSYHVRIQEHLELFKSIRSQYIEEPYPAWTAIEVSGFVTKGAMVEIKVIASVKQ